jgi:Flp pilus assembly protein protease CpaA
VQIGFIVIDPLLVYRLAIVVLIALVYMIFDVFNNRNVPTVFAYATILVGVAMTVLYYPDFQTIMISSLIAIIVCGLGYVFYKIGQIGAADVAELTAISLILPLQPAAYLTSVTQFNLPFIISVFIATGVVALLMIPLYYLPRAGIRRKSLFEGVGRKELYKGLMLLVAYMAFILFLVYELNITIIGVAVLAVVMVSSIVTIVFETPITDSMIEYIQASKFEEGDIIALNLMKKRDISFMKKRLRYFDRLVTHALISNMKEKKIKQKFPVYRKAMPLALPIFAGVILSILLGDIMLLII